MILKNHGLICFAASFDAALSIAEIVESRQVYVHSLAANGGYEPDLARGLDSGDDRAVLSHVGTTEIVIDEDSSKNPK